jgi:hypothetical protein
MIDHNNGQYYEHTTRLQQRASNRALRHALRHAFTSDLKHVTPCVTFHGVPLQAPNK